MHQIFVGRQAIFDRNIQVFAYELLYREQVEGNAPKVDGDQASSRVLLNSFMEIGLDRIAGKHPVFVNMTRGFFLDLPPMPFEKERVVLEILEDIEVDEQLVASVASLAAQGYRLALDDYEFEPKWDPLLPYMEIIKVEVPTLNWDRLADQLQRIRRPGLLLLAEKVETEEEYRQLHDLGFDLFQGYHFSRPNVVSGKRLGENHMVILKLLSRINDPDVTTEELERLIAQDPSLSYKILRYLNSAAIALPRTIESIGQAVVYLGLARLRAWASLLALSRVSNKPQELFLVALVRGHMCRSLVKQLQPAEAETAFTAGLLSILDLLLDRPLSEILEQISLSDTLHIALIQHQGLIGQALRCVLAYETQEWDRIRFPGMEQEEIQEAYLASSIQAFQEQDSLLNDL